MHRTGRHDIMVPAGKESGLWDILLFTELPWNLARDVALCVGARLRIFG